MNGYREQANLLKVLAHPVRLNILAILAQDEACVCHLTAVLRQRQPYVSQQLMLLREAGLVLDHKEGTIVYYRLAAPDVTQLAVLSRQLLQARGLDLAVPPIPRPPVAGCPCPKCTRGGICA
jgi:DNA-binding transcriptional ArsR family regulator